MLFASVSARSARRSSRVVMLFAMLLVLADRRSQQLQRRARVDIGSAFFKYPPDFLIECVANLRQSFERQFLRLNDFQYGWVCAALRELGLQPWREVIHQAFEMRDAQAQLVNPPPCFALDSVRSKAFSPVPRSRARSPSSLPATWLVIYPESQSAVSFPARLPEGNPPGLRLKQFLDRVEMISNTLQNLRPEDRLADGAQAALLHGPQRAD